MNPFKKLFGAGVHPQPPKVTAEVVGYAKSVWTTADVQYPSLAQKLGYSEIPASGSYLATSIKLAICVSGLMKKDSSLSEPEAKNLMISILQAWGQIDSATASRLSRE